MECCTRFGLLAVLCTAWLASSRPSFLRIRRIVFQRYLVLNFTKSVYLQQTKVVYCLHFFIDGFESAWPARYFFSSGNHRLPIAFYHFGKRFHNWPWSYWHYNPFPVFFKQLGSHFHHINVSLLLVFMHAHIRRKFKLSVADSLEAFL